ncbi:CoA transferase subunit A [Paenibacillus cellulositrophicus]|uniref:CoA transferase subunit A n=1 Tax=Paenibacillus cellulositrophicus TaxID=562959 RepID=UPI0012673D5F|nr:CoA-transferase [Paenibacillus cellulositrophicus]
MGVAFVSLQEAMQWIHDGVTLAISGHMDMSPMALIHELIRTNIQNLSIVCAGAAAINADLLIGSDVAQSIEFSQITLGEYGFALNFRRRFEQGNLSVREHACPSLAAALQAGAAGIPFIPVRGLLGTGYMDIRSDFRVIVNPFDMEESIAVVPAIRPDVAIFHAFQADTHGNVAAYPGHNNRLLAQASRHVIVSVEEIVTPEELSRHPGTIIPSVYITAVVHAPQGAYPTGCPGYYGIDSDHIRTYVEASRSEPTFREYIDRFIRSDAACGTRPKVSICQLRASGHRTGNEVAEEFGPIESG